LPIGVASSERYVQPWRTNGPLRLKFVGTRPIFERYAGKSAFMKTRRTNDNLRRATSSQKKQETEIVLPQETCQKSHTAMNPQLRFAFDKRKSAQAAAYILELGGGRITKGHLVKMLYAADRRQLRTAGAPITGDWPVSMPCGPVLSRILNLLNGDAQDPYWTKHIGTATKSTYYVHLRRSAPTDLLTDNELRALRDAYSYFKDFSWDELKAFVHEKFKEWEDPKGSSVPITYEAMLKASGRSAEHIRELANLQEESALMSELFAG
jgi:hypothetical protein